MINIKFPDGTVKQYKKSVLVNEVAISISQSISKKIAGAILNNKIVVGKEYQIENNCEINFLTDLKDPRLKSIIGKTAGICTANVLQTYHLAKIYKIDFIDDKFYVDFLCKENIKLNELNKINNEIVKLSKKNLPIKIKKSGKNDSSYELNNQLYNDLYGYLDNTNKVKAVKLLTLSGVYLDNNKSNIMVQRIHGIASFSNEDIEKKLNNIEEQKKHDHRYINNKVDYYMLSPIVGPGLPLWKENGTIVRNVIRDYIENIEREAGFLRVCTPVLASIDLYKTSGHLEHYSETMFPSIIIDNEKLVLRPMTCPHHCILYSSELKSYRDLPIRYCEDAWLYRNEYSGALSGLERARNMCLTDAHIFLTEKQLESEIISSYKKIERVLKDFKINISYISLSLPDFNESHKYYNDTKMWELGINVLKLALKNMNIKYKEMVGEAAFYGPKIDIQIKNTLNHDVTLATLQLDFLLPKRFKLIYVDENNVKKHPILIHQGLIGTYERFISILIEQNNGHLPLWLSPLQIAVIPVSNKHHLEYSNKFNNLLKKNNIRSKVFVNEERLSYKIRNCEMKAVNYICIIGDKEIENKTVSLRNCQNGKIKEITANNLINFLLLEIKKK